MIDAFRHFEKFTFQKLNFEIAPSHTNGLTFLNKFINEKKEEYLIENRFYTLFNMLHVSHINEVILYSPLLKVGKPIIKVFSV